MAAAWCAKTLGRRERGTGREGKREGERERESEHQLVPPEISLQFAVWHCLLIWFGKLYPFSRIDCHFLFSVKEVDSWKIAELFWASTLSLASLRRSFPFLDWHHQPLQRVMLISLIAALRFEHKSCTGPSRVKRNSNHNCIYSWTLGQTRVVREWNTEVAGSAPRMNYKWQTLNFGQASKLAIAGHFSRSTVSKGALSFGMLYFPCSYTHAITVWNLIYNISSRNVCSNQFYT